MSGLTSRRLVVCASILSVGMIVSVIFLTPRANQHDELLLEAQDQDTATEGVPAKIQAFPRFDSPGHTSPSQLSEVGAQSTEGFAYEDSDQTLVSPKFDESLVVQDILMFLYPVYEETFVWGPNSRAALSIFVERLPMGMEYEDLDSLSTLIIDYLHGPDGERIAGIVSRLYRLRVLEESRFDNGAVAETIEAMMEQEVQRNALRKFVLGEELYEGVYGNTPLESAAEPSGSEDGVSAVVGSMREAQKSDDEIVDYLAENVGADEAENYQRLRDIERWWENRYAAFLAEKRVIDRAGLDQAEKQAQIEQLYSAHYATEELQAAKAYDALRGNQ